MIDPPLFQNSGQSGWGSIMILGQNPRSDPEFMIDPPYFEADLAGRGGRLVGIILIGNRGGYFLKFGMVVGDFVGIHYGWFLCQARIIQG